MKKAILMLFTFTVSSIYAQQEYKCYHLQEFQWNPETQKNDLAIEKNDLSIFHINDEKKTIQQEYSDGSMNNLIVQTIKIDDQEKTKSYGVKSPVNGYKYSYKIDSKSSVIEISIIENNNPTVLKKYLYKN